jgi:hypothetical protein
LNAFDKALIKAETQQMSGLFSSIKKGLSNVYGAAKDVLSAADDIRAGIQDNVLKTVLPDDIYHEYKDIESQAVKFSKENQRTIAVGVVVAVAIASGYGATLIAQIKTAISNAFTAESMFKKAGEEIAKEIASKQGERVSEYFLRKEAEKYKAKMVADYEKQTGETIARTDTYMMLSSGWKKGPYGYEPAGFIFNEPKPTLQTFRTAPTQAQLDDIRLKTLAWENRYKIALNAAIEKQGAQFADIDNTALNKAINDLNAVAQNPEFHAAVNELKSQGYSSDQIFDLYKQSQFNSDLKINVVNSSIGPVYSEQLQNAGIPTQVADNLAIQKSVNIASPKTNTFLFTTALLLGALLIG